MWFPKPKNLSGLTLLGPEGLSAEEILALLYHDNAKEWRHKVGSAGASDASAKSSTRLLGSQGWVFKTHVSLKAASEATLREGLKQTLDLSQKFPLWHPDKQWFFVRHGSSWYPMSACRQLRTLRELPRLHDRFAGWTRMLEMGLRISERHGIGLDINPSNFGTLPPGDKIFYLDDEFYGALSSTQVAVAVASRIPEEPDTIPADWHGWGRQLQRVLAISCKKTGGMERVSRSA